MKNKKLLIIILIVTIIACVLGGFLYYQNSKKNTEEYDDSVKKYEKISNQVNDEEEVNEAVDAETERITQEEKILNGDLSIFAGTYTYSPGDYYTEKLTLEEDGSITSKWKDTYQYDNDGKPLSVTKNSDGTYTLKYSFYSGYGVAMINEGWNSHEYTLAPVGVKLEDYDDEYNPIDTDTSRVRIRDELYDAGPGNIFYKD